MKSCVFVVALFQYLWYNFAAGQNVPQNHPGSGGFRFVRFPFGRPFGPPPPRHGGGGHRGGTGGSVQLKYRELETEIGTSISSSISTDMENGYYDSFTDWICDIQVRNCRKLSRTLEQLDFPEDVCAEIEDCCQESGGGSRSWTAWGSRGIARGRSKGRRPGETGRGGGGSERGGSSKGRGGSNERGGGSFRGRGGSSGGRGGNNGRGGGSIGGRGGNNGRGGGSIGGRGGNNGRGGGSIGGRGGSGGSGRGGSGGGTQVFGQNQLLERFEGMIGRSVSYSVKLRLLRGDYNALFQWLEQEQVTITEEQYQEMLWELEDSEASAELVDQFITWYEKSGSGSWTEEEETSWSRVRLTSRQISQFETATKRKIPSDVRLSMERGDFYVFSEWMEMEGISISSYEWSRLQRSLRLSGTDLEKVTTWYRETEGRGGSGRGGNGRGGNGRGGNGRGESGMGDRDVNEIESAVGRPIPGWIKQELKEGRAESFLSWMKTGSYKISSSQLGQVKEIFEGAEFSSSLIDQLEEFKEEGGGSWERIKLKRREITVLERAVGRTIPSDIRSRMSSGDFSSFSSWIESERITISSSAWNRVERSFSGEKLQKLKSWYEETGGRGGRGRGSSGGGGGNSGVRKREFKKFAGVEVPDYILQCVEDGDFQCFIDWLETNEIRITKRRWNRMKDNYRSWGISAENFNRMQIWYNRSGKLSLTGAKSREVRQVFGGGKFGREAQDLIEEGDTEGFIDWLRRESIEIDSRSWGQFQSNYRKWGFSEEFYLAISEWYESEGRGGGGGSGGSRGIRKREFKKFSGVEVPDYILLCVEDGDFQCFIDWLEENEIRITKRRWNRMKDNYRSWGVSAENFNRMQTWYNRSGKLSLTGSRSREVGRVFGGGKFGREARDLIEEGDEEGFIQWLERENVEIDAGNWRQFELNYRKWGFSEEFYIAIKEWREGRGGGSESAAGGVFKELTGEGIPLEVEEAIANGNDDFVVEWLDNNGIEVSASAWRKFGQSYRNAGISQSLYRKLLIWYREQGRGGRGNGNAKANMKRIFGRIPSRTWTSVQNGDAGAFVTWLRQRNVEVSQTKWEEFASNYRSWGFSEEFYAEVEMWHEEEGQSGGCGLAVPRDIQVQLRNLWGEELPDRMKEELDCGNIEIVVAEFEESEISIPAYLGRKILAFLEERDV